MQLKSIILRTNYFQNCSFEISYRKTHFSFTESELLIEVLNENIELFRWIDGESEAI